MTKRTQTIREIFDDGKVIDAAVRRAVRKATAKPGRKPVTKAAAARRAKRGKAA